MLLFVKQMRLGIFSNMPCIFVNEKAKKNTRKSESDFLIPDKDKKKNLTDLLLLAVRPLFSFL